MNKDELKLGAKNKYLSGYSYCDLCGKETYHKGCTAIKQGEYYDLPIGTEVSLCMCCKLEVDEYD